MLLLSELLWGAWSSQDNLVLYSLQLSTVSSGRQRGLEFRSDSLTAKAQKMGCWHGNGSRNTDRTCEGYECVMRGCWQWAQGKGVFGGVQQTGKTHEEGKV